MRDHVILFDDKCPICRRTIARIIELDEKKLFLFSSLEGKTAKQALKGTLAYMRKKNSILLIENASKAPCMVWIRGRAIMRALWLLDSKYRWFAWVCYVPLFTDLVYKLITVIRKKCKVKDVSDRFFRANQERWIP